MRSILTSLEFTIDGDSVIPPSFRGDLEHKADIAEEIARFYGYDKIPSTAIRGIANGQYTVKQKLEQAITSLLLSQGLDEITTYSFISPKYFDKIHLAEDSPFRNCVTISNPLGEDTSVMRTTPVPSMMEVLSRNYNNRNKSAALFDRATVYMPHEGRDLPEEKPTITIGLYGEQYDFFSLKGIVDVVMRTLCGTGTEYLVKKTDPVFHPGRCAVIMANNILIGVLGEIHPLVCENYGIDGRAYVAVLDQESLLANCKPEREYRPLPKFPASTRDLALLCNDETPVAQLEKTISEAVGNTLESITLFDVYRGTQVAKGKKSVAFSLTMRAADRTLTDEECDAAVKRALKALAALGAEIRS